MTILTKATSPVAPKNLLTIQIALAYAVILVVLAVAQLFSFEKFLPIVRDFALPGGRPVAYFLATFIVITEVFALPYLLRMRVSFAMRLLSMIMTWLVALLWIGIALWLIITSSTVTNIGLFGDVVALAPGWLSVIIGLVFGVLAICVSWGMWPINSKK